jgi:hypothetical protein
MIDERWLKNDELTPCANCGQPPYRSGIIRVIDTNLAVVNGQALRQYSGLSTMLGAGLAEVFAPTPGVVKLNDQPELKQRFLICNECWSKPICFAELAENIRQDAESEPCAPKLSH